MTDDLRNHTVLNFSFGVFSNLVSNDSLLHRSTQRTGRNHGSIVAVTTAGISYFAAPYCGGVVLTASPLRLFLCFLYALCAQLSRAYSLHCICGRLVIIFVAILVP